MEASPVHSTLAIVAVALSAACGDVSAPGGLLRGVGVVQTQTAAAPVIGVPVEVVLAPGDEIVLDSLFRVVFSEVTEDSRCPSDVVCIWQGNAAVVLALTMGSDPAHPFTLNTGTGPLEVVHAGRRVQLLELTPYPRSDSRMEQRDYRAKLRIELVGTPEG